MAPADRKAVISHAGMAAEARGLYREHLCWLWQRADKRTEGARVCPTNHVRKGFTCMIRRRDGRPQWVDQNGGGVHPLVRVDFEGRQEATFDEAWLQNLLHSHPEVFPIEQVEPGFGELIPLCRELSVTIGGGRTGALDNLFVTGDGGLALIETKLWRNPEARRSVVAQAMEYAAAVFQMDYEELQNAVIRARTTGDRSATSLAEIVAWRTPDLDESEFIDAVSRNLRRGRAISGGRRRNPGGYSPARKPSPEPCGTSFHVRASGARRVSDSDGRDSHRGALGACTDGNDRARRHTNRG